MLIAAGTGIIQLEMTTHFNHVFLEQRRTLGNKPKLIMFVIFHVILTLHDTWKNEKVIQFFIFITVLGVRS